LYVRGRVLCEAAQAGTKATMRLGFDRNEVGGERPEADRGDNPGPTLDDDGGTLDPAELAKLIQKELLGLRLHKGKQSIPIRTTLGAVGLRAADAEDKQHSQKDRHRSGKSFHSITVSFAQEDYAIARAERLGPREV